MGIWTFPSFLWSLRPVLPTSFQCFLVWPQVVSSYSCARQCLAHGRWFFSPECILSLSLSEVPSSLLFCSANSSNLGLCELWSLSPQHSESSGFCLSCLPFLVDSPSVEGLTLIFFPLSGFTVMCCLLSNIRKLLFHFLPLIFCFIKVGRVNQISQLLFLYYSFIS